MGELRNRAAKCTDHLDLRCGVSHVVRAAHNVGDAHIHIIHNRGEGIKELTAFLDQNWVRYRSRINRDIAKDTVGPFDAFPVELKAPVRPATLFAQTVFVSLRQVQRRTVINRRLAHVQLLFTFQVQFGRRFKALIEAAHFDELRLSGLVAFQTFGLIFDAVVGDAQPSQRIQDTVHIFRL